MSAPPTGWAQARLEDVVILKTGPFGSALHKSDYIVGGTPLINPSHIRNGSLCPDPNVSIDEAAGDRLSEFCLRCGDVVMGRRGEMGRCAVVPRSGEGWLCGTGSVIARPTGALLPEFLQRFLSAPTTVERLTGDSVGSTMVNLNQRVLLALPVSIPPIKEQQRITDKLDTMLACVDACRDRLARVAPLLKRFRQSILSAATCGRLTEDFSESPPTRDWAAVDIQSICQVGTGSTPLRSDPTYFAASGTPWVTSGATSNPFVVTAEAFVTPAAISAHRLKIYPVGTLLIAMYGEGKTRGQVTELAIAATCNQACAAVIVDATKALRGYVKLALQANYFEMRQLAEGGNQPNLNLSKIKEFVVRLPGLAEQAEIVRRVETLFAYADRLEARLATAQSAIDRLTPALLAKAFRGELVPQDPADEPASELLRRLAQDCSPPSPKTRKRQAA